MKSPLSIAPWLLLTMIITAVAQESPKPASAAASATLAPIFPALGVPKPGPTNDAPYVPQPILQGGVVLPLYAAGSPFLKSDRVREAEQYNMSKAVPGRINSIVNIHNPSIEVHTVENGINTGAAVIYGNGRHPGDPLSDGSRMSAGLTGSATWVSCKSREWKPKRPARSPLSSINPSAVPIAAAPADRAQDEVEWPSPFSLSPPARDEQCSQRPRRLYQRQRGAREYQGNARGSPARKIDEFLMPGGAVAGWGAGTAACVDDGYEECQTRRSWKQYIAPRLSSAILFCMDSLFAAERETRIDDEVLPDSRIVLLHGDSLARLKSLPDASAKLIISSPPYNIGKEYEIQQKLEHYLEWLHPILKELVRVMHNNGSLCWQIGNYVEESEVFPLDIYFYPILKKLGLNLRNRIVWYFEHGLHCSVRFSGRYETMLWFTKGDDYTFNLDPVRVPSKYPGKTHFQGPKKGQPSGNPLGKNPSDVWKLMVREWETGLWNIPNVKANHPEKTLHPCQFPIELVERCVLALTDEDDWVLDPFSGVGSALLAALRHRRKAMGIDKEQTYIDEAKGRVAKLFSGELPYRTLGKPVHQPTGREKVSQIPKEWQERKTHETGSDLLFQ